MKTKNKIVFVGAIETPHTLPWKFADTLELTVPDPDAPEAGTNEIDYNIVQDCKSIMHDRARWVSVTIELYLPQSGETMAVKIRAPLTFIASGTL